MRLLQGVERKVRVCYFWGAVRQLHQEKAALQQRSHDRSGPRDGIPSNGGYRRECGGGERRCRGRGIIGQSRFDLGAVDSNIEQLSSFTMHQFLLP